jgi:hypothetical protein
VQLPVHNAVFILSQEHAGMGREPVHHEPEPHHIPAVPGVRAEAEADRLAQRERSVRLD